MGDQDGFRGLRLHNTLTGRKEDFVPLDPMNVRMYVCGPTVYDFAHIGNARPAIVFDVLFRLLRHLYGEEHVTYVRNITDVDDKIIQRAAEDYPELPLNEAIGKVTATTEKQYHEDVAALGCLPPTVEPRATEHIVEMVAMIEALVDEGYAYAADGHVLFDVKSWKAVDGSLAYGKLSRRSLDDMIAGARVEVAPYKRDPMDFVLWKPSKPGEPAWPSPWGEGRPGWHIECSAMSDKWLWQEMLPRLSESARAHPHQFDIHGGGIDLVFPHHENEIAQSRCANHSDAMARYWMHNGFLQVEGRKMAKSEGNFVTIRDNLRGNFPGWEGGPFPGLVLRHAMLGVHYRQPIDWTLERILASRSKLHWYYRVVSNFLNESRGSDLAPIPVPSLVDALNDDLNTPLALSVVDEVYSNSLNSDDVIPSLMWCLDLLGLFNEATRGAFGVVTGKREAGASFRDAAIAAADLAISTTNSDSEMISFYADAVEASGYRFDGIHGSYIDLVPVEGASREGPSIESLVAARAAARKENNFVEADRIRDELDAMGIQLKDSKDPKTGELVTTWEVKR